MEGWLSFWYAVEENSFLFWLIIFSILSTMIYNVAGVTVTKYINSLARAITDVTKTIVIWAFSLIVTLSLGKELKNYRW